MSYPETQSRFGNLLDFLCQYKGRLLNDPYRGNLETIRVFYRLEYPEKADSRADTLKQFCKFLDEFNQVSANALEFSTDGIRRLTWIKKANLEHLQRRLADPGPPGKVTNIQVKYSSPSLKEPMQAVLMGMLNSELYTTSIMKMEGEDGFDFDLDRLNDMISKPTAMEKLGVQRAKLHSTQKAFFEVCECATHNQTLAKLCLSAKTLGQGSNELPPNSKIHKVIASCKSLINKEILACVKTKIHFLPLLTSHTDQYLGNCSYLDTCHKLKNCRYLHFYTLNPSQAAAPDESKPLLALDYTVGECYDTISKKQLPPQWINCDVRYLPFNILGKFAAIISDPAWDIHMSLPYGTCKDSELLSLPMRELQDEGILMLWVTGRSIEIGRKALAQWGYTISDEMIWIKLNQLRRTIVTGRTGHWFNHSKEHLIVGVKGNPIWLNKKIDIDFIVSGTRETSRKPDELYGIVERLVGKDARKLEIFGRDNNIRPGWLTIGNQVTGTSLYEEEVLQNYNKYQAQKSRR